MKHLNLLLALHHHQPVGNLPEVLEDCYQRCYAPILDAIERNPKLRFNLSYSGPLLLFFEERHPEYLEKLKWLVAGRQVELLVDGFYEPILAEIEEDDRQAQLRLMQEWMDSRLGITPRGVWLAEGVWENSLARTFERAGLSFTIVRGERLLQAGVAESQLNGYHVTESFGRVLRIFPRDANLYRLIPYGGLEELQSYLRRMANRNMGLTLTFADNAERWGVWPGSYEAVQQSGQMEKLFTVLGEAGDWLRLRTFSEILHDEGPRGRCYLPAGPSSELGVWSLPDEIRRQFSEAMRNLEQRHDAGRFLPFFRVGSWGGFRGRYFESNLMEKKGLWLKRKIGDLGPAVAGRVRELLWQSQCNTAYWYGTAGGIYLPHLRQAIWSRLLEAQKLMAEDKDDWQVERTDFDADDREDVLLYNRNISFGVSPGNGGACFEFSLLPCACNLANTLTRRTESDPHKEGDVPSPGVVDGYERHLFQERFFNRQVTTEELATGRFRELGDFVSAPWQLAGAEVSGQRAEIELERLGGYVETGVRQPVRVIKKFVWETADRLLVKYRIGNESTLPVEACFAVESNLYIQSADEVRVGEKRHGLEDSWYEGMAAAVELGGPAGGFSLKLEAAKPFSIWSYPLLSGAATGGGGVIRQGNAILCGWLVGLKPEETVECEFSVTVNWHKKN